MEVTRQHIPFFNSTQNGLPDIMSVPSISSLIKAQMVSLVNMQGHEHRMYQLHQGTPAEEMLWTINKQDRAHNVTFFMLRL